MIQHIYSLLYMQEINSERIFLNFDKKYVLLSYTTYEQHTINVIESNITDMHRQDHQLEQTPFALPNNLLIKQDLLQLS